MSPTYRSSSLRRRIALTVLGAAVLIGTVGCSSDGASTVTPTTAGTTAPATTVTPTTAPPPASTSSPRPTDVVTSTSTTVDPTVTLAPEDIRLALVEVADVDAPTALATRNDDAALYITSQSGKVYAVRPGSEPELVLDISADVRAGGEQGLLGLAFSTDGLTAYVCYTIADYSIQIDSFELTSAGVLDPAQRKQVLNIAHPGYGNHNGGNLITGPDGMLYIGVGDGGGSGDPARNAQNLQSLLGKILRIDPLVDRGTPYEIPQDNPFADSDSARREIWSYGLRNPWKFSFDRLTGDLWVGDVGQSKWEEVNLVRAADGGGRGTNFGWSAYEGTHRYNNDQSAGDRVDPVYEYAHKGRSASVTGGFVYRGTAIPGLYGAYVFADEVWGTVWAMRLSDSGTATVAQVGSVQTVSGFGEDHDGELYALSYAEGKVYRFVQGS